MKRSLGICSIALMTSLGACSSTTHDDDATEDALRTEDAQLASLFSDKVDAPNLPSVRGYSLYRVHLTGRNAEAFDKALGRLPHCGAGSSVRDCWAYKTSVETYFHAMRNDALDGDPTWQNREDDDVISVIADANRNIAAFASHSPHHQTCRGISTLEFGWVKGKEALFGDLIQLMRARAEAIRAWPVCVYVSDNQPTALDWDEKEKAKHELIETLKRMALKCRGLEGVDDWSSGGNCQSPQSTPWYR